MTTTTDSSASAYSQHAEPDDDFERSFSIFAAISDHQREAAKLREAARHATGTDWRDNIEGAERLEADVARLRAELDKHPEQDASTSKGSPSRPRGRKPSVAPALLVQILDALESYAATTGQEFDRYAMPGPLGKSADDEGSFHWLCAQLYPSAFNRAWTTFTKHRAGLCAVAPYAKATDFYRLALPHIAPKLGATLNVHHMPKQGRKSA